MPSTKILHRSRHKDELIKDGIYIGSTEEEQDLMIACAERVIFWTQKNGFTVNQHSVIAIAITKKFIANPVEDLPRGSDEAMDAYWAYYNLMVEDDNDDIDLQKLSPEALVARMAYRIINSDDIWKEIERFKTMAGETECRWIEKMEDEI